MRIKKDGDSFSSLEVLQVQCGKVLVVGKPRGQATAALYAGTSDINA